MLQHVRTDKELAACCHLFPDPVLLGIPPALCSEGLGAWWEWGEQSKRAQDLREHGAAKRLFGKVHPPTFAYSRIKERTNTEMQMNARQFVRYLRGTVPPQTWSMPQPCTDRPPEKVNVYSDGSLKNPHSQMWALGGLGIWWPGRQLEEKPLSWAEKEFSHPCVCPAWLDRQPQDGTMLVGALTGQRCSSTRTELAAGILAIHAPGAVHQGTDSMAYTVRARRILQGEDLTKRKPWSIQRDGDLWEVFEASANAKGRESIVITKVKAHATDAMVREGITTQEHMMGNEKADIAADISISLHGKDVTEIAQFYSKRHMEYGVFMLKMRTMMLAVRAEVKRIRKNNEELRKANIIAGVQTEDGQEVELCLAYPEHNATRRLSMMPIRREPSEQDALEVDQLSAKMIERRMEQHVWGFVAYNVWGTPATGHQGATWIELFTRYVMAGGIYQSTQATDPTTRIKRVTPKQGLERFTKTLKRLVQTCLLPQDRYLFRPAKTGERRLKALAFSSHMGAVCTIPGWRPSVARDVADQILFASRGWTRELTEKRKSGGLLRQLSRYTLARVPGERYTGSDKDWCERLRRITITQSNSQETSADTDSITTMMIWCPTCKFPREAKGKITLLNGLKFRLVVCPSCKGAKQSSQWHCDCGIPWHICAAHMGPGQACRAKPRCPRGQLAKRQARHARMRQDARAGEHADAPDTAEKDNTMTRNDSDHSGRYLDGTMGIVSITERLGSDSIGNTAVQQQGQRDKVVRKAEKTRRKDEKRCRRQERAANDIEGGSLAPQLAHASDTDTHEPTGSTQRGLGTDTTTALQPIHREKMSRKAEKALRLEAKRRKTQVEILQDDPSRTSLEITCISDEDQSVEFSDGDIWLAQPSGASGSGSGTRALLPLNTGEPAAWPQAFRSSDACAALRSEATEAPVLGPGGSRGPAV
jgi:hypothetical protein